MWRGLLVGLVAFHFVDSERPSLSQKHNAPSEQQEQASLIEMVSSGHMIAKPERGGEPHEGADELKHAAAGEENEGGAEEEGGEKAGEGAEAKEEGGPAAPPAAAPPAAEAEPAVHEESAAGEAEPAAHKEAAEAAPAAADAITVDPNAYKTPEEHKGKEPDAVGAGDPSTAYLTELTPNHGVADLHDMAVFHDIPAEQIPATLADSGMYNMIKTALIDQEKLVMAKDADGKTEYNGKQVSVARLMDSGSASFKTNEDFQKALLAYTSSLKDMSAGAHELTKKQYETHTQIVGALGGKVGDSVNSNKEFVEENKEMNQLASVIAHAQNIGQDA